MNALRIAAVVAMPTFAAGAALAQEHPRYIPTTDVAVTYRVNSDAKGAPQSVRASFAAGPQKLRLESEQGLMLVDVASERATMVLPQQQLLIDLPKGNGAARAFMMNDRTKFVRRGTATVASLRCTEYDVTTERGHGTACLTDNGVLLRGQGTDDHGHGGAIEATSVTYARQPPSLFEPPPGFHRLEIPRGLGGLAAGLQPPAR